MLEEIYVMWRRQVKQFLRSKPRLLGSIAQPILFLVAMGLGFGPIFEQAGGGNYIQFLAPGIVGMTILFGSLFNGISLIWDKNFGFLKETLVAPVSRTNILIGRCIGGATAAIFQAVVVLLISYLIGFRISNFFQLPIFVFFAFLVALLFNLFGTIIASKLDDMQAFPLIMNFVVMPLFFLSGALFPVENFPGPVLLLAKLNPLSYGVDGIRYLLIGQTSFSFPIDLAVIGASIFVLLLLGNYFFNRIEP